MCSDAFVHLGASTVKNKSFLNSMMDDSVATNDFDLDGVSVVHFELLNEGKDDELDKFHFSGSSRKKAIRTANYTMAKDVALVRACQDITLDAVGQKDQTSAN